MSKRTIFPYSLNIGLTNRCNAKCFFCPVSSTKIPREDMPLELVRKILSEVKIEHHVSLALFGESTLYEDIDIVIKLVQKKGLPSILYTNGLFDDWTKLTGLDKIIFSLDAFSKEEYIRHKGVDGYDKVLNNIDKLRGKVHTTVQYADLNYEKKGKCPTADKIKMGRFVTWGGEIEYNGTQKRKIRLPKPCTHIFRFMNIASNGDMVQCCFDYNHNFVMGNVKNNHVMDVWNGDKFRKARKQQINGIFNSMCLNCENESYYSPQT